jgi:YgiT-type zinc finger domain-containing protein
MAVESVPAEQTTCVTCGGATRRTRTALTFKRGDLHVLVENVPVMECGACGEQYVFGPIGLALSDDVDRILGALETTLTNTVALTRPRSLVVQASELEDLAVAP